MCDATPLASAAPAADELPPLNTVAWFDAPSPATTRCASRAGLSIDPASADPSQSRMARRVSETTPGGRSPYRELDIASARRCETGSRFGEDGGIGGNIGLGGSTPRAPSDGPIPWIRFCDAMAPISISVVFRSILAAQTSMVFNTAFWRKWHRWIAFPATLFLLWASITGIWLGCTEFFGAEEALREATRSLVSSTVTSS